MLKMWELVDQPDCDSGDPKGQLRVQVPFFNLEKMPL